VIDRLRTARELAELLGPSASTILDWFEADRLPGFNLGSCGAVRGDGGRSMARRAAARGDAMSSSRVECGGPSRVTAPHSDDAAAEPP
jgi:hypothetical protein